LFRAYLGVFCEEKKRAGEETITSPTPQKIPKIRDKLGPNVSF